MGGVHESLCRLGRIGRDTETIIEFENRQENNQAGNHIILQNLRFWSHMKSVVYDLPALSLEVGLEKLMRLLKQ